MTNELNTFARAEETMNPARPDQGPTASGALWTDTRALPHTILESRVLAAFSNEPRLNSDRIAVEAFTGVAQLSGWIGSASERHRALAVAAAVDGVIDTRDCLQLVPDSKPV